jgi:glycosyltransferase involved in cell wall biosynthesis
MKRLAALVPNILDSAPGQRVRVESWARYLQQRDWKVDLYPFEDARLHKILYQPGHAAAKAALLLQCYLRQLCLVVQAPPCDVLLIYREAALIGPALLERIAKRLKVPMVHDVDDPIFLPYRSPMNGWFSLLKFSSKTHSVFRLCNHITVINTLIRDYATRFNPAVSVVPNCVDTDQYRPACEQSTENVTLVWIGSHSTRLNLTGIADPLRRLQSLERAPLRVIGAGFEPLPGVEIQFREWSPITEVADLQDCQIGLVPVPDAPWNHWKFFFKAVQYMAVGLPIVASSMGSMTDIVQDGVNGFLARTPDEWYDRLHVLIRDASLRRDMGAAARRTVVERFSTQQTMPLLHQLFETVAAA